MQMHEDLQPGRNERSNHSEILSAVRETLGNAHEDSGEIYGLAQRLASDNVSRDDLDAIVTAAIADKTDLHAFKNAVYAFASFSLLREAKGPTFASLVLRYAPQSSAELTHAVSKELFGRVIHSFSWPEFFASATQLTPEALQAFKLLQPDEKVSFTEVLMHSEINLISSFTTEQALKIRALKFLPSFLAETVADFISELNGDRRLPSPGERFAALEQAVLLHEALASISRSQLGILSLVEAELLSSVVGASSRDVSEYTNALIDARSIVGIWASKPEMKVEIFSRDLHSSVQQLARIFADPPTLAVLPAALDALIAHGVDPDAVWNHLLFLDHVAIARLPQLLAQPIEPEAALILCQARELTPVVMQRFEKLTAEYADVVKTLRVNYLLYTGLYYLYGATVTERDTAISQVVKPLAALVKQPSLEDPIVLPGSYSEHFAQLISNRLRLLQKFGIVEQTVFDAGYLTFTAGKFTHESLFEFVDDVLSREAFVHRLDPSSDLYDLSERLLSQRGSHSRYGQYGASEDAQLEAAAVARRGYVASRGYSAYQVASKHAPDGTLPLFLEYGEVVGKDVRYTRVEGGKMFEIRGFQIEKLFPLDKTQADQLRPYKENWTWAKNELEDLEALHLTVGRGFIAVTGPQTEKYKLNGMHYSYLVIGHVDNPRAFSHFCVPTAKLLQQCGNDETSYVGYRRAPSSRSGIAFEELLKCDSEHGPSYDLGAPEALQGLQATRKNWLPSQQTLDEASFDIRSIFARAQMFFGGGNIDMHRPASENPDTIEHRRVFNLAVAYQNLFDLSVSIGMPYFIKGKADLDTTRIARHFYAWHESAHKIPANQQMPRLRLFPPMNQIAGHNPDFYLDTRTGAGLIDGTVVSLGGTFEDRNIAVWNRISQIIASDLIDPRFVMEKNV